MEHVMDFYSCREIQLAADTVLSDNLKRADPLVIELLTRPLSLDMLCR